ncbi:MAG: 4Fe-4S dicluster domain-containing protein [Candidatus Hodarchaeales archaeon]|jgi:ferredoxin
MAKIDPDLITDIKQYTTKDFNVEACFNCGNCTAICPLSDESDPFPRNLIRYATVGLKEKILGSNQMWLCSYCNDCSDTCPRDAEPGEFVMATRRWAMSQYEVTGITRFLNEHWWGGFLLMGIIFIFSLFLFNVFTTPERVQLTYPIRLFDLVSMETVEIVGISLASFMGVVIGLSIVNMYRLISKEYDSSFANGVKTAYKTHRKDKKSNSSYHLIFSPFIMIKQAFIVGIKEVLGQYRQLECSLPPHRPGYTSQFVRYRWFMHLFILWGFAGLGVATTLNIFFKQDPNTLVSILHPIRLIGIISGFLLMLGVSIAIWNRLTKNMRYSSHTMTCDWMFLILLFLLGLTGFLTTGSFYFPFLPPGWGYWFFIAHMIVVIEIFLLAPFGKFAHVWYRSFALWIHYGVQSRKNKLTIALKKEKARRKKARAAAKAAKAA